MALSLKQVINPEPELDQQRFAALWARNLKAGSACSADQAFRILQNYYHEAHRRYHTPEHIQHCLSQLDSIRHQLTDADAVELAIWFHDVIYDPRAKDNELRSAELFVKLAGSDLSDERRKRIYDLIMATVHPSKPADKDQQYMVDIDLSSFGLPRPRFDRDSRNVRDEFVHMSDQAFYQGQRNFLQSLLDREYFFFTPEFRQEKEMMARDNIKQYFADLAGSGY